ncbi:MAG: flagellar biosynthesis protein FlhB [Planctomycetes bacterium]|nr:flagellar biosynthesis protein FlhB [Planctomycetota bacterium]
MPGDESAGERTEEATPRRRQKERERGRVAKSRDLSAALVLLGGMLLLKYGGHVMFSNIFAGTKNCIGEFMGSKLTPERLEIGPYFLEWLYWTVLCAGPFIGGIMLVALAVNYGQTGLIFSWEPLTPDLNKLNPVNGVKRLFGLRSWMTLVFNCMKLMCVVAVAYMTIKSELPKAILLTSADPGPIFWQGTDSVATMGIRLALLFLVLGIFDFGYQIYQFNQDMMMTKQEVKEEYKEMDGDPQIKAKRRQIQRQLAMQRMMQEVPQAEVVVRNPTHFAVAIKYKPDMPAPIVVAKGADHVAKRIIDLAIKNNVPVWQAPSLARQLFKVELEDQIPAALFPALAEVLSHVLKGDKLAQYRRALKNAAA